VQQPGVMDRDVAGGELDRHGALGQAVGVHRAHEVAVLVVVADRTAMRARHDHQAAVFHPHIVDGDANREHVVIGVRVERPVLVPFDRAAELR